MIQQAEGLRHNPRLMLIDDADRPAKWYFALKANLLESRRTGAPMVHPMDGPVTLRLIRDRDLICEVSDTSSTSPRMRRARSTDEDGRGLFLVAQLAQRWGTRYVHEGKTIWAEQPLALADSHRSLAAG